ncbi:hypothetical protein [Longirhabdus pacifica]|uniref:hypothetical protein n=1 Tax=Longirhabdus pacifica TaxID=2305227 RepID=UPI001008749B|nr:hypothetical protein [Longirhabdus pacifica]
MMKASSSNIAGQCKNSTPQATNKTNTDAKEVSREHKTEELLYPLNAVDHIHSKYALLHVPSVQRHIYKVQ